MRPQPWILVSPSSQGIGFELTRRLLATTRLPIVATTRRDERGMKERILDGLDVPEDRLRVLTVDVTGTVSFRLD